MNFFCVCFTSHTTTMYEGVDRFFDRTPQTYFHRVNPGTFFICTQWSAEQVLQELVRSETQRQMGIINPVVRANEQEVLALSSQRFEIYVIPVQTIQMNAWEGTSTVIQILLDAQ